MEKIFSEAKKIFYGKNAKNSHLGEIWKTETYGHTVLLDRSILIGQKLAENAKIEKLKCDIFGDFQTLCDHVVERTFFLLWSLLLSKKPISKIYFP